MSQVTETDVRVAVLENSFERFRKDVTDAISGLRTDIRELAFVRQDVYEAEQEAMNNHIASAASTAALAAKSAMIVLGMFCSVVAAAIIAFFIKLIAG